MAQPEKSSFTGNFFTVFLEAAVEEEATLTTSSLGAEEAAFSNGAASEEDFDSGTARVAVTELTRVAAGLSKIGDSCLKATSAGFSTAGFVA